MESTITRVSAPMASLDLTARCLGLNAVTRIHAKTAEPVRTHPLRMAITLVTANRVGQATIVNNSWIGVENRLAKMEPDAHKGERPMNATA